MPAGEIERLIVDRIRILFSDPAFVLDTIRTAAPDPGEQKRILEQADELTKAWAGMPSPSLRALLHAVVARVDVRPEKVDIHVCPSGVMEALRCEDGNPKPASDGADNEPRLTVSVSARLKRTGMEVKMIVDGPGSNHGSTKPDPSLVKLIVKAHRLHETLLAGGGSTVGSLARSEGLSPSYFTRVVRLAFLAPDITKAILDGRHPSELNAARLMRKSRLPLDWQTQRRELGFG